MRSVQLLIYRADEGILEVRARDFKTHWMTAVEVLDDDTYLGAENSNNLFTLRKNTDAASDEDRARLEARLDTLLNTLSRVHSAGSARYRLVLRSSAVDAHHEAGNQQSKLALVVLEGVCWADTDNLFLPSEICTFYCGCRRWGSTTLASLSIASGMAPWS